MIILIPMKKTPNLKLHTKLLGKELDPTILTIFGATGDLSADYLLPTLLRMEKDKLLPKTFKLICVGRRDFTSASYLKFILQKSNVATGITGKVKNAFLKRLVYYKGNFDDRESFRGLEKILKNHDLPQKQLCYNRLYYFATSPQYFSEIAHILKDIGLLASCQAHQRKVRILVEKPFGFNLKSAQALNKLLLKYFTEDQIYRIDHYQGKETVQNLLVVRFANSIFEPLWNEKNIDHVEISVLEGDTVKNRAAFYDQTGAIKDFVQNHILQVLSLITMSEPYELTTEHIRNEKLKILKALKPFSTDELRKNLVKGQYQGYKKDVAGPSLTESYAALKVFIDTPRWKNVPFYLRTGKALHKKVAEISVHFKEPNRCIFRNCASNILTFRIQPDESVHLRLNNKIPGSGVEIHQGDYEFGYKRAFVSEIPAAYERLLLDFFEGDQRLFIHSEEIEASWKFIDSITENPEFKKLPVYTYKQNSQGPKEAEEFMKKDLRDWWTR